MIICKNKEAFTGNPEARLEARGPRIPVIPPMSVSVCADPPNKPLSIPYRQYFQCPYCTHGEIRDQDGKVLEYHNPKHQKIGRNP